MKARPCVFRGRRFRSLAAAARMFHLSRECVRQEVERRAAGGPIGAGRVPAVYMLDGIEATARDHARRLRIPLRRVYVLIGAAQKRLDSGREAA